MTSSQIHFLKDTLAHHHQMRDALDNKASFLLGISGVIFVLSIVYLERIGFLVITITSLVTCLFSIWTVSFPFRKTKKKAFGLMCWWGFEKMGLEEYTKEIEKTLESDKAITREYLKEIYALSKHSLKPKSSMIRLASFILTVGLIAGGILLVLGI